ncbi:PGPGW domain-containing protein [bacterium]|nr:PGPGW domain-containing protein [bacterium]
MLGLTMIIAGIAMLVLPGPGIVFIFGGLYLIATVVPGGKERVEVWRQQFNQWREERRSGSRRTSRKSSKAKRPNEESTPDSGPAN